MKVTSFGKKLSLVSCTGCEYTISCSLLKISINLFSPRICKLRSIPLSNLIDASDIKLSFLEVFITETLSKYALSIIKFFVSSVTSVSKPPITPAKAIGLSSETIIRSSSDSFRF